MEEDLERDLDNAIYSVLGQEEAVEVEVELVFNEIRQTDNWALRSFANICGRVSDFFLRPYIRWGDTIEMVIEE